MRAANVTGVEGRVTGSILVVDDSEELLEVYEQILAGDGHEVMRATNGQDALRAVADRRPDVILLNMMMPGMDGLEFLGSLSRVADPPLPPVIVNSGFEGYREEALRRGARVFLRKPLELETLADAVRLALMSDRGVGELQTRSDQRLDRLRTRAAEEVARERASIGPGVLASALPWLQGLTDWLRTYFDFGIACVNLVRGSDLHVEATTGGAGVGISRGTVLERVQAYCDDVVDAGATLCITDSRNHLAPHFSDHPFFREVGLRFYVGAPLTTGTGVVLGTLCLMDTVPHESHPEDARLMGRLAARVGRDLSALGRGEGITPIIEGDVFADAMLAPVAEHGVACTTRTGGELCIVKVRRARERRLVGGVGFAAVARDDRLALVCHGARRAVEETIGRALRQLGQTPLEVRRAYWLAPGRAPRDAIEAWTADLTAA